MTSVSLLRLGNIFHGASLSLSVKFKNFKQCRTIVNKALLKLSYDYPEAWDYKEHGLIFIKFELLFL